MTKLKEEFFKILPPTIYFFVALHLVMFIRVLMLEGTGLPPFSSASIAVTALVLGKAVLVAIGAGIGAALGVALHHLPLCLSLGCVGGIMTGIILTRMTRS